MHISFYLMVPLISLSIMLVAPHLNFHSNAIAIEDGSPEGNGFYNNYENDGSQQKEMVSITTMKMITQQQKEMVSITTMKMMGSIQNIQSTQTNLKGITMTN